MTTKVKYARTFYVYWQNWSQTYEKCEHKTLLITRAHKSSLMIVKSTEVAHNNIKTSICQIEQYSNLARRHTLISIEKRIFWHTVLSKLLTSHCNRNLHNSRQLQSAFDQIFTGNASSSEPKSIIDMFKHFRTSIFYMLQYCHQSPINWTMMHTSTSSIS